MHAAVGDDEEGWNLLDPEALDELGMLVDVDLVEHERFVIPAALEHLGDEALDAPAATALFRVEEHESRPGERALGYRFCSLRHWILLHSKLTCAVATLGLRLGNGAMDRVPIFRVF